MNVPPGPQRNTTAPTTCSGCGRRVTVWSVPEPSLSAALDAVLHHSLDLRLVRDVDHQPDPTEWSSSLLGSLEVGDDDAGVLRSEAAGDSVADALRASCHDRDTPLECAAQRMGEKAVGRRIRFCCV